MKETPGSVPDEASRLGVRHIQRGEIQTESFARPVPRQWLADHEQLPDARRLERLMAVDLVQDLRRENFDGPKWLTVAAEFARYGLAVLMAWIATRSIFGRLRQRGVGGLQQPPEAWLDQHAVQELADETVVVSLNKFRSSVLIPGKWDHTRGPRCGPSSSASACSSSRTSTALGSHGSSVSVRSSQSST